MVDRNFRVKRRGKDSLLAVGTEREDGSVEVICQGIYREAENLKVVLRELETLSTSGVEVAWDG